MFQTIIVGLDGSERSLKALLYAQSMCEKYGAALIMLHAYPHTSDLHAYEGYDNMVAQRKSQGERILDAGEKAMVDAGFPVERDLLEGPAADAFISTAEIRHADLIVIGIRGMSTVKGLLFGSVATKVSHHAPCPVLLVR